MGGSDQSEADGVAVRLQRAREAIGVIRADIRGVAAINAHASDPEGVDEDIDDLAVSLRELLEYEATNLFPLVERLSHGDAERLREAIESASRHQTSLPDPPENGALRRVAEVKEAIGLSLNDHSTRGIPESRRSSIGPHDRTTFGRGTGHGGDGKRPMTHPP